MDKFHINYKLLKLLNEKMKKHFYECVDITFKTSPLYIFDGVQIIQILYKINFPVIINLNLDPVSFFIHLINDINS